MNNEDETLNSLLLQAQKFYDKPDEFLDQCERVWNKVQYSRNGDLFLELGVNLHKSSYINLAIYSFDHALMYYTKNNDIQGKPNCYGNLGFVYRSLADCTKSNKFYEKALEIAKQIGDLKGEAECYQNLGIVYSSLADYAKAIELHQKALECTE